MARVVLDGGVWRPALLGVGVVAGAGALARTFESARRDHEPSETGSLRPTDRSAASVWLRPLRRRADGPVTVTFDDEAGRRRVVVVDGRALAAAKEARVLALERAREDLKTAARRALRDAVRPTFDDARTRGASDFADWYFAYGTT